MSTHEPPFKLGFGLQFPPANELDVESRLDDVDPALVVRVDVLDTELLVRLLLVNVNVDVNVDDDDELIVVEVDVDDELLSEV